MNGWRFAQGRVERRFFGGKPIDIFRVSFAQLNFR